MSRLEFKIWTAPLATLQSQLDEGEVGIAAEDSQFYKRPDGSLTGALIAVSDARVVIAALLNQANGIAGLDATGHLPATLIPASVAGGASAATALAASVGQANGVASLDAGAKLLAAQIPASVLTAALLGAAGGIATLDAGGKIPAAMIPAAGAGSVSSATLGQAGGVATLDGSAKLLAAQIPASVITTAQVGAASGVASLDATGKVPAAQLSAVGFTLNLVTTATLPAVAGNLYVVTVQNTLTMGSTPTVGDQIQYSNQSGLTTCVVARGGSKINGLAEDMTVDGLYASFILRYVSPAIGWITL